MAVFQGERVAGNFGGRVDQLIFDNQVQQAGLTPEETRILQEQRRQSNIPENFQSSLETERRGRGLTPTQIEALNLQRNQLGQKTEGLDYLENLTQRGISNIDDIGQSTFETDDRLRQVSGDVGNLGKDYYQGYMDRGSYTMGSLEQNYPELYKREQDINAQTIGDQSISPYLQNIGSSSIDPYLERVGTDQIDTRGINTADIRRFQDPYMQDVVDASLQDFDVGVDRASNLRRARQAGAGAFGGRQGLYDATIDAEQARQRGGLGAGLRSEAYQQALGSATRQADLGQTADISDLERGLQAQRSNQQTMLEGGQTQLQRDLQAAQYNQRNMLAGGQAQLERDLNAQRYNQAANLQGQESTASNIMDRKFRDAGLAYQGDKQRLGAIDSRQANLLGIANIANQRQNLAFARGGLTTEQQKLAQEYARLGLTGQQVGQEGIEQMFNIGTRQFAQPFQLLDLGTNRFGGADTSDENEKFNETAKTSSSGFDAKLGFGF
tara:strand:+ start:817 stop:2304 length:1488 start_codon:yes stop_codon:yes gene_type:complete